MLLRGGNFKFILLFVMVVATLSTIGQTSQLDSLQRSVDKAENREKVDALNTLAIVQLHYGFENTEKTLAKSIKLATALDYKEGLAKALIYKGLCENFRGNKKSSLNFLYKAQQNASGAGLKGYGLVQIGNVYLNAGNYDSAKYWYDKSYEVLKDSLNPSQLSVLYRNLAKLYNAKSRPSIEYEYLSKSYAIRKNLSDKILYTDILLQLVQWYIREGEFEKAHEYLEQAENVNPKNVTLDLQNDITYQKSILLFYDAKYREALKLLNDVNEYYLHAGNVNGYIKSTLDIADMLEELGSNELSMKKCFEAIELCKKNHFKSEELRAKLIIGWNYYDLKQLRLASDIIQELLIQSRANKFEVLEASAENLLGNVLIGRKDFDDGIIHFYGALEIRKRLGNPVGQANIHGNMAQAYLEVGQYEEAIRHVTTSMRLTDSLQDMRPAPYNFILLSKIYVAQLKYKDARLYWNKAQEHGTRLINASTRDAKDFKIDLLTVRRDILLGEGKVSDAMQVSLRLEKVKDSLNALSMQERMVSLQASYQLDQQTRELKLRKEEIALQKEKIQQQRAVIVGILIGSSLLIVLLYVSYWYYKKAHDLNLILQERNEEVLTQSEELTEANSYLSQLNHKLEDKNAEIEQQAHKLAESNEVLQQLNTELAEKTEELASQSEELAESNQIITNLNQNLEEKVLERTQELEQAYKELDTFFYRSSHDFRRPLTTFMGLAEVAKITVQDAYALELFSKVNKTAVGLDRMLVKLQSISDFSAEHFLVKSISVRTLIENACTVYNQELLDGNIKVDLKVTVANDLLSYPTVLKTIIENLIENAISFRRKVDSLISIEASDSNDGVELLITDNGIGIDEMIIPRITEMFFRGSELSVGNGLGLYIVKKGVEKLRGELSFKSCRGKGTTVRVWLPYSTITNG